MILKEFIEKLSTLPQDLEVYRVDAEAGGLSKVCGAWESSPFEDNCVVIE